MLAILNLLATPRQQSVPIAAPNSK
jgi:hypothetical protein